MPRFPVALLLAAAVLAAGCASTGGEDAGGPADAGAERDPGGDEAASRAAVAGLRAWWYPGLTFRYDVQHAGMAEPRELGVTVLAGHTDPFYLHPSGDEEAIRASLYWGLPPIGAVTGSDLDPLVDGEPLGWFDFPLEDGKTWTGRDLDGEALEFAARRAPARLPDAREVPGYEVVATRDGTARLGYTYTSEAGWFTEAWRDEGGDGEVDAVARLVRLAIDPEVHAKAPVAPLRVVDLRVGAGGEVPPSALPPAGLPAATQAFAVPEAATEMHLFYRFAGGPGAYRAVLAFADGEPAQADWVNEDADGAFFALESRAAVVGDGDAVVALAAPDASAHVAVVVLVPAGA